MGNYTNRFFMGTKLFFAGILAAGLLISCEESGNNPETKDSLTDTVKHANIVPTVTDPIGPVSKRISDSIYEGAFIERYDNGVIRKRGDISGGLAHGEWLSFYPDGKVWSKGTYLEGLRTGYAVSYHPDGSKSSEGYYKKGQFVGNWKFWDEHGSLVEKKYGGDTTGLTIQK